MTPNTSCYTCIHSTGERCELSRIGYPHVGDWCAAYAEGSLPEFDEAIQTPESIPSKELNYEADR